MLNSNPSLGLDGVVAVLAVVQSGFETAVRFSRDALVAHPAVRKTPERVFFLTRPLAEKGGQCEPECTLRLSYGTRPMYVCTLKSNFGRAH